MRCDSASTRGTASIRSQAWQMRCSAMSVVNSSWTDISRGGASPVVAIELLAFAEACRADLSAFRHEDGTREEAGGCRVGLPPQRLCDDGHRSADLSNGNRVGCKVAPWQA